MSVLRNHWPWLCVGIVPAAAQIVPLLEYLIFTAALLSCFVALLRPAQRRTATLLLAALLIGLCLALALHLLLDHFNYRYVWLYSAAALPPHLKVALLWGGEEGTLLLMATLCGLISVHLYRFRGWAAPGSLLLTLVFIVGTLLWNPFAAVPAEFAAAPPRGMNAHLTSVWMVAHPPLILLAYALLLAPVGSALQLQIRGTGDWQQLAARYTRGGWLILSTGLGFGMWWAFQDFTFGAFWHWDPVQTSVFMVWALATAQLHGLARISAAGFAGRSPHLLAMTTAIAVAVSMLVTRDTLLASSHRYVGDTSIALFAVLAIGLGVVTAAGIVYGRGIRDQSLRRDEPRFMLSLAMLLFTAIALIAGFAIAHAFASELLGFERLDSDKPFLGTLLRWSTGGAEIDAVRRAFAQWDVDGFALNRYLAPCAASIGLVGGHAFLRGLSRHWRWSCTSGVFLIALLVAVVADPFDGMTSQRTVAIFFWLNVSLVTAAYLALAAVWWVARPLREPWDRHLMRRRSAVGAIHLGAMLALVGAMTASVLDAYVQRTLKYPQDFGESHTLPDGYTLWLNLGSSTLNDDGARSRDRTAFRAVTEVSLGLQEDGGHLLVRGSTLYRDERVPPESGIGPVRQLCQLLDYRYARYATDASYLLNPFVYRSFWADVQVWVPPPRYESSSGVPVALPSDVTVVVHRYPLLSLLWAGLVLALIGAAFHTWHGWRNSSAN